MHIRVDLELAEPKSKIVFACKWEGVRLPQSFGNSVDFPKFPELSQKFLGDFPATSLTVDLRQAKGFPDVSQTFPEVTRPPQTSTCLAHRNRSDFCDLRLRCPAQTPESARFPKEDKAMLHCDLRVRWKVASDLRFRAAISEPETPSFCGISGDLAQSTRKSLAIAIVRFWCAKRQPLSTCGKPDTL